MNIVMFSNTFLPAVGGIEISIDTTARALRGLGHRVLVVAPEYVEAPTSDDQTLRVPAIKQFAGSAFSINLSLPSDAGDQITRFAPKLIHSHQPFLLGDSALRLARTLDVPIVYTNHTFMERYLHWFPVDWRLLRDIAEILPVTYANLVDHVIAPTRSVADVLRTRGTRSPISVVPTGIDAAFYGSGDRADARARWGLPADALVLGHLGRLNAEKNLSYLARVAAHFVAGDPDRRRFLLVGEGDAVDEITQAFVQGGVRDRLVQTGVLRGRACADAYAAMDAFVFTSVTDTQGLVLSEAMAAGNPVFALDAPGARDLIEHEHTGLLFDAHTCAEAFAGQMAVRLTDVTWRSKSAERARRAARALSVERCAQTMLDLYTEVVADRGPPRDEPTGWDRLKHRWDIEMALIQQKLSCLIGSPMNVDRDAA